MNKEYFTENISVETLAELIDETLNYEKNKKTHKTKTILFRMIPSAAVFLLIIGIVNFTNIFSIIDDPNINGTDMNEGIIAETSTSDENETKNPETAVTSTQIGDLVITTPTGLEPVENGDGTITLPGGGMYQVASGDKITAASGTIIKDDGNIPGGPVNNGKMAQGDFINMGKKITIERVDGDVIVIDEDGMISVNGKTIDEIVEEAVDTALADINIWGNYFAYDGDIYNGGIDFDWDAFKDGFIYPFNFDINIDIDWDKFKYGITTPESPEPPESPENFYWDSFKNDFTSSFDLNFDYGFNFNFDFDGWTGEDWYEEDYLLVGFCKCYKDGNNNIYELNDGTKITMSSSYGISSSQSNHYAYMLFYGKCTIEFTNGVTIKAQKNTAIELKNDVYTFIIGNGEATVTKADGTSSVIPGGAIIDDSGNQTGYMWQGDVNEWAKEVYEKSGLKDITGKNNRLGLLQFMNGKTIDEIALKESEKSGFKNIYSMIVYISTKAVDEAALKSYDKFGIDGILNAVVYMGTDAIDEIAVKESEKSGFNSISQVVVYMSTKAVSEAALKSYEKFGIDGILNAVVYMSTNAIDEIAVKESEKSGFNSISQVVVYMSTKAVDEAALKSYDKFGIDSIKSALPFMSQSALNKIANREKEK